MRQEFPEMKGLRAQNLKYMRKFAETYDLDSFGQQLVDQIPWVSQFKLTEKLPEKLKKYLPTPEKITMFKWVNK